MGEAVFIAQYDLSSNSPTAVVSRAARQVTDVAEADAVTYRCQTIGGSAGAPVIAEKDGALLGLHVAGENTYNTGHGIRLAAVTTSPNLRRLLEVRTDLPP
jgi:V8-like Glu-specific endopeptidase